MIDNTLFTLKGIKTTLSFLLVIALVQSAMTILQAIYLAKTITNLFHGEKLSQQLLPIVLFFLSYFGKHMLILWREKSMLTFSATAGSTIRQQFADALFQIGPNVTAGTGNVVTMALEGISQVETYLKLFLPKVINVLVIPLVILVYTFTLDSHSAIVLFLVLPTLIFFMIILGYAARNKADKQYEAYQTLSNHFVDSLRGLETLRLLGLSKRYDRNIREVSERYRKSTMGTLTFAFLSTFALEFFSSLSVAIIALFLGLGLIDGNMLLFPALTILILAPEYFAPIREVGTDYHATLDGKNALQAINNIIALPKRAPIDQLILDKWDAHSKLEIANLTLQHEESNQHSLTQLAFSWEGYGKIGVIGASGAGKSTLINVLGGFLEPTTASIKVAGQDLDSFGNPSWQEQILYIPQHPYIFNDTVAHNIAFYTPDASLADIEKACTRAGLTSMIASLPNGLAEKIGESGRVLSGGQEQRIALARAFLDDQRKILLFDEPTAHLDIETEWELKQSMLPLLEDRLVFFATHRLHWMVEMDWIIVLDHGEIVEMGTHKELLQAKGYYHQLIQAQMHGSEVQHHD